MISEMISEFEAKLKHDATYRESGTPILNMKFENLKQEKISK